MPLRKDESKGAEKTWVSKKALCMLCDITNCEFTAEGYVRPSVHIVPDVPATGGVD